MSIATASTRFAREQRGPSRVLRSHSLTNLKRSPTIVKTDTKQQRKSEVVVLLKLVGSVVKFRRFVADFLQKAPVFLYFLFLLYAHFCISSIG